MRKPEELLAEVGRIALKSNFKTSTAIIMGASSLVAIALIERYSPRVSKVVRELVKSANLHINLPITTRIEVPIPVIPMISHTVPVSRHPEGHAVPRNERQEGRSEVIHEIAQARQN